MLSPHIIHIFFHPAFQRAADFENYRISTIVHQEVVDRMPPDLLNKFTDIAVLKVPHNMNLNEYDDAMDQIVRLADTLAERHGRPEAIVGLFEHVTLPAAKLREHFGLPGTSSRVAELCRDKVKMKAEVQKSGVHVPRFLNVNSKTTLESLRNDLTQFSGKVVYKPRSQAASEGVQIFDNANAAIDYVSQNGFDPQYQFEEFIEGTIAHFDGVVRDGKLLFFSASEYVSTCLEFVNADVPLISVTLDDVDVVSAAKRFTELVLAGLHLRNSVFHLEAFHHGDGRFTFLEIGSRFGGAGVSPLINKVYGVDLVKEALLVDLSQPSAIQTAFTILDRDGAAAWLYVPMPTKQPFVVKSIQGVDHLPKTIVYSELPKVGEHLNQMPMPFPSSGRFFLKGPDSHNVRRDCQQLLDIYKVSYEETK